MAIPWASIGTWLGNNAGNLINLGSQFIGQNQQTKAVEAAAKAATPIPYSGESFMGTTTFNPNTKSFQIGAAQNPFAQLFNIGGVQSLANAYSAPGSAYWGAAPELATAAREMGGAAQAAEAQNRYNILTGLAKPEENRMFQRLENNLFARGQMGTSGGGEHYRGFYEAQNRADLERQLASQDWAQSRGMARFNTALGAVGSGQAGQVNTFNMGTGSFGGIQNLFQALMSQANTGIGAGAGTPSQLAAMVAENKVAPWQMGADFLKESGAFDALGRWIGSKLPTGESAPTGSGQPRFGSYEGP